MTTAIIVALMLWAASVAASAYFGVRSERLRQIQRHDRAMQQMEELRAQTEADLVEAEEEFARTRDDRLIRLSKAKNGKPSSEEAAALLDEVNTF